MAAASRMLDVWVVDTNTVYQGVPFTVVADWVQQGRLLESDRVRLAGNKNWHPLTTVPALVPYLPRIEPQRFEDAAEAMEPVNLGFHWQSTEESEDEDVDMIPLIDISLVLLIFFMMTATVAEGVFTPIQTPAARYQLAAIAQGQYWIGIDTKFRSLPPELGEDGNVVPWYSLGLDQKEIVAPTKDLEAVLTALDEPFGKLKGEVRLRLRAERTLPLDVIRKATTRVQEMEARLNASRAPADALKLVVFGEVSEPKQP
jgi:hypothetical protein